MNTHQINQLISNSKFDSVLVVIDKYVFVNLDWLTNRDYQSQGVNELIFSVGQYTDHIFVFLIRDGVNCRLTGLSAVIETVIKNLNLTPDTCYIYGYDDLAISNSTFVKLDVIQMWCSLVYQELKDYQHNLKYFNKKFAALFGRHDLYRLKITKHLYQNYRNDCVLSYNSKIGAWHPRLESYFADDKEWYQTHCPILLDFDGDQGWVPYQRSLQEIAKHTDTYFLELVAETDTHSNKFFTEKTLKNFYIQKPFILMSGQHSLLELQNRGFRTFAPWINETYDQISCPNKRLYTILSEIDRISTLSLDDLNCMYQEMLPVFEHNKQNFLKICLTS
jgi:hypothetical protein